MLSVRKELRVAVTEMRRRHCGSGLRFPPARRHAVQRFCWGPGKQDRAGGVPGTASRIEWRLGEVLHNAAANIDALQLTGSEKCHRSTVRRPERVRGAFSPRQEPRRLHIQRPKPELILSFCRRLIDERVSVG